MTCQSQVNCNNSVSLLDLSHKQNSHWPFHWWPLGLQMLQLKWFIHAHFSLFINMCTRRTKKNSSRIFYSGSDQKYISKKYFYVVPAFNPHYLVSLTSARKCNGWELICIVFSINAFSYSYIKYTQVIRFTPLLSKAGLWSKLPQITAQDGKHSCNT